MAKEMWTQWSVCGGCGMVSVGCVVGVGLSQWSVCDGSGVVSVECVVGVGLSQWGVWWVCMYVLLAHRGAALLNLPIGLPQSIGSM